MSGTAESTRKAWITRRRIYGETGTSASLNNDERFIVLLMDRWMTVHDIRSIGERAVRETA